MPTLGRAEAFAKYKAKLRNVQWSACAVNNDGELVVSLWRHHIDRSQTDALVFKDSFDRWSGHGNNEFREKVTNAYKTNQDVRLIIADTEDTASVEKGVDASTVKKTYRVRPDLIGKVTDIEGGLYTVTFVKDSDLRK